MEIHSPYVPNQTQSKFHASSSQHKVFIGGLGTTDLNTLIYEADLQRYVSIKWLIENKHRPSVLSYTTNGWVKMKASMPYFEGLGPMYRVHLKSGKFIFVGDHHRFLTERGFVRTCDLRLSDRIFCADASVSKDEHGASCGQLESGTAEGSTGDCWMDLDLCDERPLDLKEVCLKLFPSLFERLSRADLEVPYFEGVYLRPKRSCLKVLAASSSLKSFLYEETVEAVQPRMELLEQKQSAERSSQGMQDALSAVAVDLEPTPFSRKNLECISWVYRKELSSFELKSTEPQALLQLKEFFLGERGHLSKAPSLSSYTCSSAFKDPPDIESSYKDEVVAIEYAGVRAYFDLHVPLTNNYLANGMVNHNSGKTTACSYEIIQCMNEFPGSLWLIGRKFLPALKDSTFRSFMSVVPNQLVKDFNKRDLQLTFKNGSQSIFRPLYDAEILKSMEISGFFVDEANEIGKDIYDRLKDRMRQRLPDGGRPRYQSMLALNPTDEDHWIPQLIFTKPKNLEVFQNSTFENMENLPDGYIEELKTIYSDETLQRFLYGQFGRVHTGRAVYPQFRKGPFVKPVEYIRNLPLIRGWDFGYNHPFCCWLQVVNNQVRVLAECLGKQIYLDDFVREMVLPRQIDLFGEPYSLADYCDPRGSDQSDKGVTSVQILNSFHIYPRYRRTTINEGIRHIKGLMDTLRGDTGEPNFLIHPRCQNLIEGLNGGYAREEGKDDPRKDGFYDHGQDALRYACIFIVEKQKFSSLANLVNNKDVIIHKHTGYRREFR